MEIRILLKGPWRVELIHLRALNLRCLILQLAKHLSTMKLVEVLVEAPTVEELAQMIVQSNLRSPTSLKRLTKTSLVVNLAQMARTKK
jgi:hypothetical protein